MSFYRAHFLGLNRLRLLILLNVVEAGELNLTSQLQLAEDILLTTCSQVIERWTCVKRINS